MNKIDNIREIYRDRKSTSYMHVERISAKEQLGSADSSVTLIHDKSEDILYVIYDWAPESIDDVHDDSFCGFNKQLRTEHESLTLAAGAAIAEYVADYQLRNNVNLNVVYTGFGWGGALAVMQAFIVPPSYLVTFGQPPVGNHFCSEYLDTKVQSKKSGRFVYDRYTYLKDPLAKNRCIEGYEHIEGNHLYINRDFEKVANPSWFYRLKDGFMWGGKQAYAKLTYDFLMRTVT
jgi:hypothetical protein